MINRVKIGIEKQQTEITFLDLNIVSSDLETSKIKKLLYMGSNIVPANVNRNLHTMTVVYPSISLMKLDKKKTSKNEMFDNELSQSDSIYK